MKHIEKLIRMIKKPVFLDLWQWSKAVHWSVIYICILNFIVSGGVLAIAVATRGLIDGAAGRDRERILFNAIFMCVTVLMVRVCYLLSGLVSMRTGAHLLRDLRAMMLEKILKKQYEGLDKVHSGELLNRMFSDVRVVRNGIMEIIPGLLCMAVSFTGAAVILIRIDWRFAVVLILAGSIGLFLLFVFNEPMKNRHSRMQRAEGKLHAILQETLENLRLIKASGSEKRMERQVAKRQSSFVDAQLRKGYFAAYLSNGFHMLFQLGWLFCMLWGCFGIYRGRMTYGMLAAMIQLVGLMQTPVANVAGAATQICETLSSAERLKEILDLPEEEESDRIEGSVLYRELKEIQMRDMDFSYGRGEALVLEQVSVRIKRGDFVAVTGVSGGGKSTLLHLILGIYQPVNGTLRFRFANGREEAASRRMRSLFAYVPQGNTLFSGTIRENLTMFTDEVTEDEIREAVRIACIDRFLAEFSEGLDTVIGERGIGLSEGQAQRVSVARALLSRAPILLLDECTSALDEETEAELLQNIAGLKDRTCLIVTHRKAALRICDYRIHIAGAKVSILK